MFVNILDFGAQPENVNFDSAPAFNKAIQALPSVGERSLFLMEITSLNRQLILIRSEEHTSETPVTT